MDIQYKIIGGDEAEYGPASLQELKNWIRDGRVAASFEIVTLTAWAPHESQPKPLRPGSATTRLADALGTVERPAGDKATP